MTTTPKGLEEAKVEPSHFAAGDSKSMTGEVNALTVTHGETHRGLSSRHIQFLALGGCIGTGLFVGSGATLSLVGPGECAMNPRMGRPDGSPLMHRSPVAHVLHRHVIGGLGRHERPG